jgi:predicted GIY-YIG superfamily endonuclease
MTEGRTTLYELSDGRGRLLYVGISCAAQRRFREHARRKGWAIDVVHALEYSYATREEALRLEEQAIKYRHPLYNIVHKHVVRSSRLKRRSRPDLPWCDVHGVFRCSIDHSKRQKPLAMPSVGNEPPRALPTPRVRARSREIRYPLDQERESALPTGALFLSVGNEP